MSNRKFSSEDSYIIDLFCYLLSYFLSHLSDVIAGVVGSPFGFSLCFRDAGSVEAHRTFYITPKETKFILKNHHDSNG